MFLAVGGFEEVFERRALRRAQLIRAPVERRSSLKRFRGALAFHDDKFIARMGKPAESRAPSPASTGPLP